MLRKQNNKGFTLVELLVVVAIIVVLSGVLFLAINPAALLAKGRDAKRLEDMDALNKAIGLALADGEIILTATGTCSDCNSSTGTQSAGGTGYVKFSIPTGKTGLSKFVAALPVDPTNSGAYVYTYAGTISAYELNAVLESVDYTAKMSTDGGNDTAVYEVGASLSIL